MDSSGDELAYLSPDFDLNSLTVPRIRAILVSHDISYPSSAKKAQLIAILEDEVLPKAKKLLRERERVRRTSKGITNMPSSQESLEDEEDERDSMPPPPTPSTTSSLRRGRSRMSTRASTAETEEFSPPPPPPSTSRRKTATPARTVKHPRASDTETGEDVVIPTTSRKSTARKSRKSEALGTPHAAQSVEDEDTPLPIKREDKSRRESAFTNDNPFQSGSSPSPFEPQRARTVSRDGRRKTSLRYSSEATPAKEGRRKRMTEPPYSPRIKQENDVPVPTRSTFEMPVSSLHKGVKQEEPSDDGGVDTGEEFAPEEELELARERAQKGEWDVHPTARRRRQQKSGSLITTLPWLVVFTLFGLIASWYRKEKLEIGFCGAGKPHWSLTETQVPDWVDTLGPQCEICPQHAYCYPDLEASCEQDFVLKPHPLSLGGLIPLPPTCEPDGEKVRRVKAVADKAVEELRERRVKWECGEPDSETGEEILRPEITEPELKEDVGSKRRKGMSEEEFEDLWKGALGEIVGREEVVTDSEGPSSVLTLTSTSLARLSISCALRRHLRLTLLAYRLPISLLGLGIIALLYTRSQLLARRSDSARVPELVSTTLDRLATQAALHSRGDARESWIPVGQLRDDVLRSELKGSRREELWKRVRTIVEGNANVRAAVREGRGGDVARVWEWIGGVGGVGELDGGSAEKRRESGKVRFSLSPTYTSPIAAGGVADGERTASARKWDEGRPVY
ncbi:inner nuclear membrane protein enriched at telomere/subtelomere region [Arachnomyces sp. PD_36]|nr:inner nuclear membrane protein enriched at telomere/subtelomere region [Arachnomyces sp. PD_36]